MQLNNENNGGVRNIFRNLIIIALVATLAGCATRRDSEFAEIASEGTPQQTVVEQLRHEQLWDRLRSGYALPDLDSPLVAKHERWYSGNPAYINRMVKRAHLYLYYIVDEVEKRGMPMEIALLPAIESAFKPHAYSRARAAGLWQFIPSTGRHYGLEHNWWYDGRRDVVKATQAALDYLEILHKAFDGNWHLALAAYNAGETRVKRAIEYNRRRGRPIDYKNLRTLKRETLNYVPKLLAISKIIARPEFYGITLASIPNEPYFSLIEVGSQIDLGIVARMADISLGDLYDINPAFKRRATAPNGPHSLLVPAERRDVILSALGKLPEKKRIRWQRHVIRPGDALSTIARRYGVTVRAIKRANRIRGTRIRAGRNLLIPISTRRLTAYHGNVTRPIKRRLRRLAAPKNGVKLVHLVRRGDTLWDIAIRYNVYIYQVTGWNGLRRRALLRPGQKLTIWVDPADSPTASTAAVHATT
ncbi:MAG: transglycosylase SLT domain-containing protein [Acidiferrobacterales bacterium]